MVPRTRPSGGDSTSSNPKETQGNLDTQIARSMPEPPSPRRSNKALRQEIISLQGQTEALQAEILKLHEEKETFQKENHKVQDDLDILKNGNEALKNDKDTLEKHHETLKRDVETLSHSNQRLRKDNETLNNKNDTLEKNSRALGNDVKGLKKDIESLQNNNEALKCDNDFLGKDVESLKNATEILKSEGQDLQKSLREKNDANLRFENLCKALKEQANEHIEQKKELAEANSILEGKIHSLSMANKTMEKSLDSITKLFKSQANELEELNKTVQHLNTEAENLGTINRTLLTENAQIRKAKEAADDENKYLRGDLDKWQIETMAYQSAKSRLEAECKRLNDSLRDERNKATQKEKEILSLEDTLFKTDQAKTSFESQLNTMKGSWEKSLRELRIQTENNGTLTADLSIANAQLEDATDSNTAFTRTKKALEDEIRKLRSEVANLNEVGDDHHQIVETLKSEVSSCMANQSGLEVELERVKKVHRNAESRVSKAAEKVSSLECELMEMKTDNDRLMNEVTKEKKVQQKLKSEMRSEQTLQRETAGELASLRESSKSEIANLEVKIKALTATIKSTQDELRRATIEASDSKTQLNELESEHSLCKHTVAKLTEKVKTWRAKWDEAVQRELDYDPEHLRQQLEDRQTELRNLTTSASNKEMSLQALLKDEQANHQNTKLAWNDFHQTEVHRLNDLITEVSNHARDVDSRAAGAQNRITEANAIIEKLKLTASHDDCVRYEDANSLLIAFKNLFEKYHDIKKHKRGNYAVTYFQALTKNANGVYELLSKEKRMEYGRVVKW